jgi:hypothetical protein
MVITYIPVRNVLRAISGGGTFTQLIDQHVDKALKQRFLLSQCPLAESMRQDSSTARVCFIIALKQRGCAVGRFRIPHRIFQHVLLAFVLTCPEAIDVLPCCLARYERYLIWRYPDDVSILVVQLSYILFGSATQHVTDVWQSSDSIDLGTGDAAEWIVV